MGTAHKFVVADFSAIEARVIAWLAGEEWRQEVFRTHGKIYEASAAAMFGVSVEKIKKGNPEYALRACSVSFQKKEKVVKYNKVKPRKRAKG